jgi:hypothetical protein
MRWWVRRDFGGEWVGWEGEEGVLDDVVVGDGVWVVQREEREVSVRGVGCGRWREEYMRCIGMDDGEGEGGR